MPKAKDFFAKLKEQGKINNPEYDTFLQSIPDMDIPDVVEHSIEENFMTMDRAMSHKDILFKIKREVLNPVDNELVDLFSQLKEYADPTVENEFKKDANSYNKLKALKKLTADAIERVRNKPVVDEDTKKKLAEYERNIQEMTDKFKQAEKTYNAQLLTQQEASDKQFRDFRLDAELQNLGNKFTLAQVFEETRSNVNDLVLAQVKKSNTLNLIDNNGQTTIQVLDEHGKPKFNGNTPVTIESILAEKYKPYLKVSEGKGTTTKSETTVVTPPNPAIRKGSSTTVQ